jgi:hypothetical protein
MFILCIGLKWIGNFPEVYRMPKYVGKYLLLMSCAARRYLHCLWRTKVIEKTKWIENAFARDTLCDLKSMELFADTCVAEWVVVKSVLLK